MYKIEINNAVVEYDLNTYILEIVSSNKIKPISKNNIPCNKFSSPETKNGLPKIYVVLSNEDRVLYIGQTIQSISTRIRQGLNPQTINGYHGYKWKNEIERIKLKCFNIPKCSKDEIESIEAELVYNYRNEKGVWPIFQTEIHFHNNENTKELAKKLFEKIL